MEEFVSERIDLPATARAGAFSRADLVFYGVDARGPSYVARVFLDGPGGDASTDPERSDGYAGSFTIFGHGGCFGDEGHCDLPPGPRDPFDLYPPHPLTPQTKIVRVTDRLRALGGEAVRVTVVAVVPDRPAPRKADVMSFSGLRLLTYR